MNPLEFINQIKDMYNDQDPRPMAQGSRNMYSQGQLVTPSVDGSRPGYKGVKGMKKGIRTKDYIPVSDKDRIIAATTDRPVYTKKLIKELGEDLPKGVSLLKDKRGRWNYQLSISPRMKKPGIKEKPITKSYIANSENKKLAIDWMNEKVKKFFPNAITDEKFTELRLKNKKMTAKDFAELLNEKGYTTNRGNEFKFQQVSDLQTRLNIGKGITGPRVFRTVDEAKKIIRQYPDARFFFASNPTDSEITSFASNLLSTEKRGTSFGKGFPTGTTTETKMWRNFHDSYDSKDINKRIKLTSKVPIDADGNINWKMIEKNGLPAWKNAKFYDTQKGTTYTWGKKYKFGDLKKQVDAAYHDGFFNKSTEIYRKQKKLNKMTFKGKALNEWMRESLLKKELELKLKRKLTSSAADKDLLKDFYTKRKPSFSFTEAHHIEGVGKNPFKMEMAYKYANRKQGHLQNKYNAGNLTREQYIKEMENLSDTKGGIRYKTDGRFIGQTGTQRSIATAAAKDAGLTKQLRSLIIKLCPKGQASGGRIGYQDAGAVTGTLQCGINQFNKNMKTGNANSALMRRILASGGNILKSASKQLNPAELLRLRNLMGPQALGFIAAYEVGDITDDILRKNIPVNEALAKNWLTKTFLPYREQGARAKNLLQSGKLTTDAQKKYALDLMKSDQAIIKQEQLEQLKLDQGLGYGGDESGITNEMIDAAEKDLERRVSAIGDSVFTEGSAIGQEYQALEDEMIASRLDKFKLPFQSDKGTRLVNKLARPSGRRIGPMTAKREMKVDFSLPTYDRNNITEQDVRNMYKDEGWISPTEYKSGYKLSPGELTWWRMQNPGRGTYGTQEKFMGGGIVGIRKPHAIPPKRQGLRSIMINVNDD